jgi:predicted RNA-binding Zn ribbon-like protein
MVFAHDTTAALVLAADLVNSTELTDVTALDGFLDKHLVEPRRRAAAADLDAVLALRPRFRAVWQATDTGTLAGLVNELLSDSGARPRLTDHGGGWGWHLHVTGHDAALEHRIAAQAGFAFADLVRMGETGRLRLCEAPDCDAVLIDLSKNRSRRYCDTGNCGNRQHVAAYRERLAGRETRSETRPVTRSETRPETLPEARSETRPETLPEARSETRRGAGAGG